LDDYLKMRIELSHQFILQELKSLYDALHVSSIININDDLKHSLRCILTEECRPQHATTFFVSMELNIIRIRYSKIMFYPIIGTGA